MRHSFAFLQTALVLLFTIHTAVDGLYGSSTSWIDAALPGCVEVLSNATLPWCNGSGSEEGRRRLIAAAWKCNNLLEANGGPPVPLRVMVWDTAAAWLVPAVQRFSALYDIPVGLDQQPYEAQLQAMRWDLQEANATAGMGLMEPPPLLPGSLQDAAATAPPDPPPHALSLYASSFTEQLADHGMLLDMSELVSRAQLQLDWVDVAPPYRLQLSMDEGRTVAVPLDAPMLHLLYRSDVTTALGLTQVAQTWTQLVQFSVTYEALAASANFSAGSGSLPPYPICIARGPGCRREAYVQAVWSSIAQTHGSTQPTHFDSETLEPLFNTPATRAAFRILAQLLSVAAPLEPEEACDHGSLAFARGRCALALAAFVPQMKLLSQHNASEVMLVGAVRAAPLPGSELVWQHTAGSNVSQAAPLVPCTPSRCPHAMPLAASGAEEAGSDSSAASVGTASSSAGAVPGMLVNRAPQAITASLVGSINSRAPFLVKLVAFELLSYLASPERFSDGEPGQSPLQYVLPPRGKLLQPRALDLWQAAGYDRAAVQDALPLLYDSMQQPNLAWGLRMDGQTVYNKLIGDTLAAIEAGNITVRPWVELPNATSTNSSTTQLQLQQQQQQQSSTPLYTALAAGQTALAAAYPPQTSLGAYKGSLTPWTGNWRRAPPAPPGTPAAAPAGSSGGRLRRGLLPVLLGVLLPVAIAGLGAAAWHRTRRRGSAASSFRGPKRRTYVPAPGVKVALCVTDIQDSTTLWECLPADVVAKAVDIHHRCVRRLALRHGGYESATEGDSFILAFEDVRAAVAFALDLQARLLDGAPWPKQLLRQEVCQPVFTHLPAGFPFNQAGLHAAVSSRFRRASATTPLAPLDEQLLRGGGGGGEGSPAASRLRHDSLVDRSQGGALPVGQVASCRLGSRQVSRPWESSPLGGQFLPGRSLAHLMHAPSAAGSLGGGAAAGALAAAASLPLSVAVAESTAAANVASQNPDALNMGGGYSCGGVEEADGSMSARPSHRLPSELAPWQLYRRSSGCGPSEITFGSGVYSVSRSRRPTAAETQMGEGAQPHAQRAPSEVQFEVEMSGSLSRCNESLLLGAGGLSPHMDSFCDVLDGGIASGEGIDSRLWDEGEGEALSFAGIAGQPPTDIAAFFGVDAGAAAGEAACKTFLEVLQEAVASGREQQQQQQEQQLCHHQQQLQLLFRGLRVRVGISVAVPTDAELRYNAAAARMVYGGACVAACKALADLAHGGQVFLSAAAHRALALENQGSGGRLPGTMVLQVGILECPGPPAEPALRPAPTALSAVVHSPTDSSHRSGGGRPGGGSGGGGGGSSGHDTSQRDSPSTEPQALQDTMTTTSFGAPTQQRSANLQPAATHSRQRLTPHQSQPHQSHAPAPQPRKQQSHHVFSSAACELLGMEPVYWVTSCALSQRMAFVPPPRFRPEKPPVQDVYQAPLGRVSYLVLRVPAIPMLLRWNAAVASESLRLLMRTATSELRRVPGAYLVSATPSEVRVAFPGPALAVSWALHLRAALLAAPWPAELLLHEAGEPVETYDEGPEGAGSQPASDPATPRSNRGSAALLARVSSRMPWGGVAARRGSLPGAAAAAWEAVLSRASVRAHGQPRQQHRRHGSREGMSPLSSRAELHLSTESGDDDADALEPLGRIAASTPLRRYRHSIEGGVPSPSANYRPRSRDVSATGDGGAGLILGEEETQALAQLASHFGSPSAASLHGHGSRSRGRSNTGNGILATTDTLAGGGTASGRRRSALSVGRRSIDMTVLDSSRTFRSVWQQQQHATPASSPPPLASAAAPSPRSLLLASICQRSEGPLHARDAAGCAGVAGRAAATSYPASPIAPLALAAAASNGRGDADSNSVGRNGGPECSASSQATAAGVQSGGGGGGSGVFMSEPRQRQRAQSVGGPPCRPQFGGQPWVTEASPPASERGGSGVMRGELPAIFPGAEPSSGFLDGGEAHAATGGRDGDGSGGGAAVHATGAVPVPPRRSSTVQPAPHGASELASAVSAPIPALPWRMAVSGFAAMARQQDTAARPRLLLRGLRIHVGIATGVVGWTVSSKAHSLAYTGRAVTKACRLAAAASSGQVLCDAATQQGILAAQRQHHRQQRMNRALSLAAAAGSPLLLNSMRMRRASSRSVQQQAELQLSQRLQRVQAETTPPPAMCTAAAAAEGGAEGPQQQLHAATAALDLRLVPFVPPGASRLSIRPVESMYLCAFESDTAPQLPRLAHALTPPSPFATPTPRVQSHARLPPSFKSCPAPQPPQPGTADAGAAPASAPTLSPALPTHRPRAFSALSISPPQPMSAFRVHSEAGAAPSPAGVPRTPRSPMSRLPSSTPGWAATSRGAGATSCPGLAPPSDGSVYVPSSMGQYAERGTGSLALSLPTGDGMCRQGCCSHAAGACSECYGGATTTSGTFASSGSGLAVGSLTQPAVARLSPSQRFRSSAADPPYLPYIVCERVDEEDEASDDASSGDYGGDDDLVCSSSASRRLQCYEASGLGELQKVQQETHGSEHAGMVTRGSVSRSTSLAKLPLQQHLAHMQSSETSNAGEVLPATVERVPEQDCDREIEPEDLWPQEAFTARYGSQEAPSASIFKQRQSSQGRSREATGRLVSVELSHAGSLADLLAANSNSHALPTSPGAPTLLAPATTTPRRPHALPQPQEHAPRPRTSVGSLIAGYGSVPGTEDSSVSFTPILEGGDPRLLHASRHFFDSVGAEGASCSLVFERQQSRGRDSPSLLAQLHTQPGHPQHLLSGGAPTLRPVSPALLVHLGSSNGRPGSGHVNPPTLSALAQLASSASSGQRSDMSGSLPLLATRVYPEGVAVAASALQGSGGGNGVV
ncbi:hypothetical protein Agub_g10264 [Astrephomene gubernaculifera]|uniref:Guanylate cyclase domain-containing protein n=1 Tax=Astrephomene gubernaculifera TaxID=47775 RepID=A0AAD3DUH7_9CHLO|nr:hypothetical protein Agub_g10264 [Astrephomene gubernaculifera]